MSYRSPQYIKDKRVDIAIKQTDAAKAQMDKVDDQRSAIFKENLSSITQGAVNAMTQQKKGLKNLNNKVSRNQLNMYKRVGGKDFDTGFSDYDQQAETLFYDAITKYNEIKTHLDNNTMLDSEAGKKDLAKIENMIDVYSQSVPNIISLSRAITQEAGPDADKFSATGAPAWQLGMILDITNNEGEVQIKQENGNLYLYDPSVKYKDEDGKEITGGKIDLIQLNKMLLDENNPYLKYQVDSEPSQEAAYKTFMYKDDKLKDDVSSDGKMTKEQQQNYMNGVTGLGSFGKDKKTNHYMGYPPSQFETILAEGGESYWVDIMGEDAPWDYGKYQPGTDEFDNFIETQYKPALERLAHESLENNTDGIEPEDGKWFWDESSEESDTADEEVVEEKKDESSAVSASGEINISDEDVEESSIVYGAKGFNTKPTEKQAENLKKAAKEPKTEDGFIKANQIFEENAGRTDGGKLSATPQTEEDLRRYFYTEEEIPNTKYSDGNQKYGTKKLFPTGKPNTAVYDMAAMINMNSSWDPRIIAAIAGGEIKVDERGDYLFGRNEKELQKSIDLSSIDPQKMLNEMTDLYKNTYAKSENSSEMKEKKQLPEQYASYIERVKFIADRYGLELPKGYNEFGRPEEVTEEDDITEKVEYRNKSNVL